MVLLECNARERRPVFCCYEIQVSHLLAADFLLGNWEEGGINAGLERIGYKQKNLA